MREMKLYSVTVHLASTHLMRSDTHYWDFIAVDEIEAIRMARRWYAIVFESDKLKIEEMYKGNDVPEFAKPVFWPIAYCDVKYRRTVVVLEHGEDVL